MPRQKSKPSPLNWAHELREVLTAKTREPKGEGWMTRAQFCATLGISEGTGQLYLRRGVASGHLEKFCGTANHARQPNHQTWYRPVVRNKDKT